MLGPIGARILARAFLTVGALLPYWPLLTFRVVYVTDDRFASDIFNGELPGRLLVGQLIGQGQLPVWTNQLCSGLPLAGAPVDPIGLAAFAWLPPAAALDFFVIVLLLVAAHGAYGLAQRLGTNRPGAVLAGLAFAGSGYIACQLKHLAIVSTVAWLPVGLLLIERALNTSTRAHPARRALALGMFGLVFAQQVLSGFPQSAYICALVYGAFALSLILIHRPRPGGWSRSAALLVGFGAAAALGAAAGAVILLPLAELGRLSDRASAVGWQWSTELAYWPPNALTFLLPYIHGDISNNSYVGPPFFWEDYGYVGAATFLLAIYGAVRDWRRPLAAVWIALTIVAYLLVLGPATPVFRLAYLFLPGMSLFRFPTRFLIVVELGLAVLAAIGLTRLAADSSRRWSPSRVRLIQIAVCLVTALDLFIHQPRQNPMVPAREWLTPPQTVDVVRADSSRPRTFTPGHRLLHRRAFQRARGWTDVTPYFDLRDVLEPNVGGGFWNVPSADCYAGAAPRWVVDVWGDHNRDASLMSGLASLDFTKRVLNVHPMLETILGTYGVTHVLSPFPQRGDALTLVSQQANAYVYRVDGSARVRFVHTARHVANEREAITRLRDSSFEPDREVLLHDAELRLPTDGAPEGPARGGSPPPVVTQESSRDLVIAAEAAEDGFLVLADTFYPGWTAYVDGRETPVYRANVSIRAIALPKGRHEVRFTYAPLAFERGLRITQLSAGSLLLWVAVAAYMAWRARR